MDKPLPKRFTIIITRQKNYDGKGCVVVPDFTAAVEAASKELARSGYKWPEEIFICGGGEIYKESLPVVDRIYLTHIKKSFPGDAFYPEFNLREFKELSRVDRSEPVPFSFLVYERI